MVTGLVSFRGPGRKKPPRNQTRTKAYVPRNIFQRPDRPGFYVRLDFQGRRIVRGSYSTAAMAQIALADLRRDLERGTLGLPVDCRLTLAEFAEQRYLPWARQHKRTWSNDELSLRSRILPKLGALPLAQVTLDRVERYLSQRLKHVKPSSANREAALLRRMMGLAWKWDLIAENPLRKLDLFREPPPRMPNLQAEDEARLLAAAHPWLRRIVQAALLTGARKGELVSLQWRHVDFDQRLLVIPDSKSGLPRSVPLHPALLQDLKARRGHLDALVFTLDDGRPVDPHTCSQGFRRLVRKLGLPLRFHDLRHVAATRMLSQGAGVIQIASLLGHRTLAMTRRYSHVTIPDLRKAIEGLPEPAVEADGSPGEVLDSGPGAGS